MYNTEKAITTKGSGPNEISGNIIEISGNIIDFKILNTYIDIIILKHLAYLEINGISIDPNERKEFYIMKIVDTITINGIKKNLCKKINGIFSDGLTDYWFDTKPNPSTRYKLFTTENLVYAYASSDQILSIHHNKLKLSTIYALNNNNIGQFKRQSVDSVKKILSEFNINVDKNVRLNLLKDSFLVGISKKPDNTILPIFMKTDGWFIDAYGYNYWPTNFKTLVHDKKIFYDFTMCADGLCAFIKRNSYDKDEYLTIIQYFDKDIQQCNWWAVCYNILELINQHYFDYKLLLNLNPEKNKKYTEDFEKTFPNVKNTNTSLFIYAGKTEYSRNKAAKNIYLNASGKIVDINGNTNYWPYYETIYSPDDKNIIYTFFETNTVMDNIISNRYIKYNKLYSSDSLVKLALGGALVTGVWLTDTLGDITSGATTALGEVGNVASTAVKDIGSGIGTGIHDTGTFLNEHGLSNVTNTVNSAYNDVHSGLNVIGNDVTNLATNLANNAITGIEKIASIIDPVNINPFNPQESDHLKQLIYDKLHGIGTDGNHLNNIQHLDKEFGIKIEPGSTPEQIINQIHTADYNKVLSELKVCEGNNTDADGWLWESTDDRIISGMVNGKLCNMSQTLLNGFQTFIQNTPDYQSESMQQLMQEYASGHATENANNLIQEFASGNMHSTVSNQLENIAADQAIKNATNVANETMQSNLKALGDYTLNIWDNAAEIEKAGIIFDETRTEYVQAMVKLNFTDLMKKGLARKIITTPQKSVEIKSKEYHYFIKNFRKYINNIFYVFFKEKNEILEDYSRGYLNNLNSFKISIEGTETRQINAANFFKNKEEEIKKWLTENIVGKNIKKENIMETIINSEEMAKIEDEVTNFVKNYIKENNNPSQ